MKVKVSELTGRALNYAVTVAEWGDPTDHFGATFWWEFSGKSSVFVRSERALDQSEFNPEGNWAHGGPLIEEYSINLQWEVTYWSANIAGDSVQDGPMPLVAACRTIVCLRFGEEIEIPDELCEVVG
ncbi:phage protein NinX family protein [Thalassospira marina]|uniref:DUF2591 domain-containing protein n=1 Tax=Thalassospira marina TaxID=2048283 RepID=A0A2N3KXY7_9PROT|nr:phage protein NinX family protein [Thalassospira marina]PKR55445.1 hypothetical protein COO20_04550 [Thalassospira marina]